MEQGRTNKQYSENIIDFNNCKPLNISVFVFTGPVFLNKPSSPLMSKGQIEIKDTCLFEIQFSGDIQMISAQAQTLRKLIST